MIRIARPHDAFYMLSSPASAWAKTPCRTWFTSMATGGAETVNRRHACGGPRGACVRRAAWGMLHADDAGLV